MNLANLRAAAANFSKEMDRHVKNLNLTKNQVSYIEHYKKKRSDLEISGYKPYLDYFDAYYGRFAQLAEKVFADLQCKNEGEKLKLKDVLKKTKFSWTKIYPLIVAHKEINFEGNKEAWVNGIARACGVSPSIIWNCNKAGSLYASFYERNSGRGISKLEDLEVSAANLVLIDRIAHDDEKLADDLIFKLLRKRITASDLKRTWDLTKASRKASRVPVHPINSFDNRKISTSPITQEKALMASAFNEDEWFRPFLKDVGCSKAVRLTPLDFDDPRIDKDGKRLYDKPELKYRTVVGLNTRDALIDMVLLENLSVDDEQKEFETHIHAFTFQTPSSPAWNPPLQECDYAHYFWLVCPDGHQDEYLNALPECWGLITHHYEGIYHEHFLSIVKMPTMVRDPHLENTLMALLLKIQ